MIKTNPILSHIFVYAQGFGIRTADGFLIILGLSSFGLIILSALYRTLTHHAMNRYIEMLRHSIGSRLLETYLRQPYAFFLDRHSGELSKTILSEVDQVVGGVYRPLFSMVAYSLTLIAITGLLLLVNPWLALLAAGLLSGLYALVFSLLKQRLTCMGRTLVSANKERFMAASEALGGIKDIKLLGRERSYLSRFEGPSQQFAATQASSLTINQVPKYLIEAFAFGGIIAIVLFLMIRSGGLGNSALGQILPVVGLYAFAAYRLQPAIQNIFQGFASLRYGHAVVDSVYADLYPKEDPAQLPDGTSAPPLKAKQSIALKRLSYTYPRASNSALRDLNLDIPVGSSVGLVGSTGAGKTTLVDIILGLLRPSQGAIYVDGVAVSDARVRAWQQSLGYVPQEIFLTDTTIAENIALGIPSWQIDQAQVERCARMAQIHEFIVQELPEQYQTLVGERGVRLSGGQRQRIGIARALYNNPDVLVFDEATSALDSLTEQAVMEAIHTLAQQKTIFLIAHRLSTVKNCDQIVLLERGAIRAKGAFDELRETNEQFKFMTGNT
jgi:ATP-binding cassette, subfamily B, bacterial PglK